MGKNGLSNSSTGNIGQKVYVAFWLVAALSCWVGLTMVTTGLRDSRAKPHDKLTGLVKGVIVSSEIRPHFRSSAAQAAGELPQAYSPAIAYEYFVSGASHVGHRIASSGATVVGGRNNAARVTKRYPRGQKRTVHFDPDQPWVSALELNDSAHTSRLISKFRLVLGLGLVVFGLGIIIFQNRCEMWIVARLPHPRLAVSGARVVHKEMGYARTSHRAPRRQPQATRWLFAILGILLGLAFLVGGVRQSTRGSASEDWPSTDGVVLSIAVSKISGRNRITGTRPEGTYAEISYQYSVGGKVFVGDQWSYGGRGIFGVEETERRLKDFAQGTPVVVFYDPEDPQRAVLEQGTGTATFFILSFGVIALFSGLLLIVKR